MEFLNIFSVPSYPQFQVRYGIMTKRLEFKAGLTVSATRDMGLDFHAATEDGYPAPPQCRHIAFRGGRVGIIADPAAPPMPKPVFPLPRPEPISAWVKYEMTTAGSIRQLASDILAGHIWCNRQVIVEFNDVARIGYIDYCNVKWHMDELAIHIKLRQTQLKDEVVLVPFVIRAFPKSDEGLFSTAYPVLEDDAHVFVRIGDKINETYFGKVVSRIHIAPYDYHTPTLPTSLAIPTSHLERHQLVGEKRLREEHGVL